MRGMAPPAFCGTSLEQEHKATLNVAYAGGGRTGARVYSWCAVKHPWDRSSVVLHARDLSVPQMGAIVFNMLFDCLPVILRDCGAQHNLLQSMHPFEGEVNGNIFTPSLGVCPSHACVVSARINSPRERCR